MKRRTFLKKTAGGTLVSSLAFSAATRIGTAGEDILVGIITQERGPHLGTYLDALAKAQGVASVALSDESGATFARAGEVLGEKLTTYQDHGKMLQEAQPRAVLISLAAHLAPPLIRKSLEAGAHVLAEKPACVRAEDFEPLVRLADSRKLNLMLALGSRLHPAVRKARELVESGFLGRPFGAHLVFVADQTRLTRPRYHESWLAFKDKAGGGQLIWLGIHYLDLVQYLTGDRIEQVAAVTRNVGGQPVEIEDSVALALRFKKGMVGTYHGGYYLDRGYHLGVTLWGSQGWLRMNLLKGSVQWYSTHPDAPRGIRSHDFETEPSSYYPLVQSLVDLGHGKGNPPLTGEDSLHVLKVVFGAYQAAETGLSQRV